MTLSLPDLILESSLVDDVVAARLADAIREGAGALRILKLANNQALT